jgi:hypothetical protein
VVVTTGGSAMEPVSRAPTLRAPHTPASVGGNTVAHEGDGVSGGRGGGEEGFPEGARAAAAVAPSRAPRAVPLIGLGGARANGMMAARAVVHGFCARSGAVLCHDGSA